MIAKLRHFVPSSALTNIYKSSILTYLTYGLVAWGNTSKNYLNKVVVLQKRVLIEKNMQSPCLKMRKFCLLPSYIMKLYVNECSMFITTVHLLISWNLLRELQTSIHALLAPQRHNSIAFSTLGLKCKKKSLFVRWCQSLEWETQWILKFVKEILQKRNKKSSSQYSRNWRFLYGAWWDNAKIQTQQNWIKFNQFFNIFCTLRNTGTFSPT